jgi:hypothetical protein
MRKPSIDTRIAAWMVARCGHTVANIPVSIVIVSNLPAHEIFSLYWFNSYSTPTPIASAIPPPLSMASQSTAIGIT